MLIIFGLFQNEHWQEEESGDQTKSPQESNDEMGPADDEG